MAAITFGNLVGQAIADPQLTCESVLAANPTEVEALAATFQAAGASTEQSATCALRAQQLAEAAAMIDDQTPVQLMDEVTATQDSLDITSAELYAIGAGLSEVGGRIRATQTVLHTVLDAMHAQIASAAAAYESGVSTDPASDALLDQQCTQSALAAINTAAVEAQSAVAAYDAFLTEHLGSLQTEYGYVAPSALDDGAAGVGGAAYAAVLATMPDASTSPAQVQQWWDERTYAQKVWLIGNRGAALSEMHGLPAQVLDLVNSRELTDDAAAVDYQVTALEAQKASLMDALGVADTDDVFEHPETAAQDPSAVAKLAAMLPVLAALKTRQANIHGVQQGIKAVPAPHGTAYRTYLLEYDDLGSADDGEAVIAIGDPDAATDIAVVVPGTTSSTRTIRANVLDAGDLYAEMDQLSPDGAASVITYLGMDAPDSLPLAALTTYADAAAPELAADVAGYAESARSATGSDPHVTVIGHSYGSLVVGTSLESGGLAVDDVVFVGSPGVGVDGVQDLHMDGDHVFVGMLPEDKISLLNDAFDVGAGSYGVGSVDGAVFGRNPAKESFGAVVFDTDQHGDHGDYFDSGTVQLDNMAAIAVGEYDEVTLD